MADVKTRTYTVTTLTLDESEVHFLRNLTQNFLGDSRGEPPKHREIRTELFNKLNDTLKEQRNAAV